MYFPNRESLRQQYQKLKDARDEEIASFTDDKDYIPLRPIVTKNNEKLVDEKLKIRIERLKNKIRNSNSKYAENSPPPTIPNSDEDIIDDIDDFEEIIGDDAYAAFLNDNAEIEVQDTIYKYTDVGLFIVAEDKYAYLKPYLDAHNISDDLLIPTDETSKMQYIDSQACSQVTAVYNNDILYFNALDCTGSGGGSGSGGNTPPVVDSNTQMANFINGLQNCNTYSTFLQDLFGDSNMCVDRYEDKYRVKTKAFNYNYLLVYNFGVKVKHQYKGWTGLWRKENAEQMRLGVLLGTFSYDYSQYFNQSMSNRITTIYHNSNRLNFDANPFWSINYFNNTYSMTGYSIQNYPSIFKDDYYIEDILRFNPPTSNISILDFGLYSALQAGNSQLASNRLNDLFWDQSGGLIRKLGDLYEQLGQSKPNNNITYSYNALPLGKIIVGKTLYKGANNVDDLEKTFDWGFQIGFNISDDGHVSPSVTTAAMNKPQEFKVLMYGIAKRNGQWHGSKINTL